MKKLAFVAYWGLRGLFTALIGGLIALYASVVCYAIYQAGIVQFLMGAGVAGLISFALVAVFFTLLCVYVWAEKKLKTIKDQEQSGKLMEDK